MLKQAAIKTADKAGDGTTTATLLAREMINMGLKKLNDGANAVDIKKGIDKGVEAVVKELNKNSEEIASQDQLEQIATISANNDETVWKINF